MAADGGVLLVVAGVGFVAAALPCACGLLRNPMKAMLIKEDSLSFLFRYKEVVFQWDEIAAIRIVDKHMVTNVVFTVYAVPVGSHQVDEIAHYLVVFRHDGSHYKTLLSPVASGRVWRALGQTRADLLPGGGSIKCACEKQVPVMKKDAGLEKVCPNCSCIVMVPPLSEFKRMLRCQLATVQRESSLAGCRTSL